MVIIILIIYIFARFLRLNLFLKYFIIKHIRWNFSLFILISLLRNLLVLKILLTYCIGLLVFCLFWILILNWILWNRSFSHLSISILQRIWIWSVCRNLWVNRWRKLVNKIKIIFLFFKKLRFLFIFLLGLAIFLFI